MNNALLQNTNNTIPSGTVNGRHSTEAEAIRHTYIACKQKLANPNLEPSEQAALNFYCAQLINLTPCADEDKGNKFYKGFGGYGDSEIIKPYVLRDTKTNKPLLNSDNTSKTILCRFRDLYRYMYTINSQKAESLNYVDGVRALSELDQMRYEIKPPYYMSRTTNKER